MTSAFVDLATYDEIEKYMYGGSLATAYFCRETKKSTWFTQVPVVLSRSSGETKFGNDWSVNISRAGDYLLSNWLTLTIPKTQLKASDVTQLSGYSKTEAYIQWTPNLMHNLISDCYISFNDLVAAQFNNFHLDFWAAFTVPASKSKGYNQMIGNTCEMLHPTPLKQGQYLPGGTFHLPLPFFYTRDSGVALPTAALPYNDMKINFCFRDWSELVNVWTVSYNNITVDDDHDTSIVSQKCESENLHDLFNSGIEPTITNCNVWANYAIVSNDERKKMACAPRDMLIEQVQWNTPQKVVNGFNTTNPFPKGSGTANQVSIRYAHAIKVLFFSIRNSTYSNYLSNYNTRTPMWGVTGYYDDSGNISSELALTFPGEASVLGIGPNYVQSMGKECHGIPLNAETSDPLHDVTLTYESTHRLSQLKSGYYSMVNPYFTAPRVPVSEVSAGQTVSLGSVLARHNTHLDTHCSRGLNGPSVLPAVSCDGDRCVSRDSKSNRINSSYSDMIAGMAWGNYPTGVHSYSYSLDFNCLDPMGSTNYGKLTNIVVNYSISNDAAWYGSSSHDTRLYVPYLDVNQDTQYIENTVKTEKNNYEFLITAVNNNIIRISGGALGFPVL